MNKEEKELLWVGDSKKILLEFPMPVRKNMGYALHFAQAGTKHPSAKPLKGLGNGVFEVIRDFNTDTYRAVYAISKKRTKIFVVHAFKKKSTQGIKTSQKELALIKQRLQLMQEIEHD